MLVAAPALAGECSGPLFVIERSTNANTVVYEARLLPSGAFDETRPLAISWRLADGRREGLSRLERAWVYGADVEREPHAFKLALRAVPSRPLRLELADGFPRVTLPIGAVDAVLSRVFIEVARSSFVPSVRSIELEGQAIGTGEPVHERIQVGAARSARRGQ